ncbi:MAG: M17 family metallopeptidase, partial [Gammaproteobacteria bacterium]
VLARLDQLLFILPVSAPAKLWSRLPDGARLRTLSRRLDKDATLHSRLSNSAATGVVVYRLPKSATGKSSPPAFEILGAARKAVGAALRDNPRSLGIMIAGVDPDRAESIARATVLAALSHAYRGPSYQSKPGPAPKLTSVRLLGLDNRISVDREVAESAAINLARWLVTLPANRLDAKSYRNVLKTLAKSNGWRMTFFNESELKKLGAGAFLAVSQGNATPDAGIVRLQYRPAKAGKNPAVALVGKGIIFDTGGNNLKPFKHMLDMHTDMGGSAIALATLQALTQIDYPEAVDCWLAITENRIDAKAYKSRDVVTAVNGVTIEVIHTDAEGRMVLADTLALAGKEKPGLILDYATLTGACVYALTNRYSGVFTNRTELNSLLIDNGVASGERVWPFPMDADFDDDIESKVADVLQCSIEGEGDQILAARFLQRFVPDDVSWVHMDLSADSSKKGLAQVPAGATGFGVRYTLGLLLDRAEEVERIAGPISRSQ